MMYSPAPRSSFTLRDRLSNNPYWIAAIASLGLHGLFWVVLPFLPLDHDPSETEVQRPVDLVELTPEEQSRLPDMSSAPISIPTAPSGSSVPPSLPKPGDFTLTPLPNQNSVPSVLPPFYVPPLPPFPPLSSMRPSSRQPTRLNIPNSTPRVNPDRSILDVTPSPQRSASPSTPRPSSSPNASPSASPTGSPSPGSQATAPSSPAASPSPTLTGPQLLARLQQERPTLYRFNERGTAQGDAITAYGGWLNAIGQPEMDPDDLKRVEVKPDFPPEACPLAPEVEDKPLQATFGVVVSPDDKLVGDPALLRSSGYGLINFKALEAVLAHEFENETDTAEAYLVNVTFTYNNERCQPAPQAASQPAASPTR